MKARPVEGLNAKGPLRPNMARIIQVRLEELRGFAATALVPSASEAQHNTRIAAKRLRYLLEIFAGCIGEEAEEARRAAKRLQSTLGDLHDCDLMLPKVEAIPAVAALLRRRRDRLYREFVEQWQAEASRGTWAALEAAVRS